MADGFYAAVYPQWRSTPELWRTSNFDLIIGSIALALDPNGFGVVKEAIEQRRSQGRVVVEDAGPSLYTRLVVISVAPCS